MIDGGLRSIFRSNLTDGQWVSIESPMTGQGIPDTEYIFKHGRTGWIEYKKTNGNTIPHVRPEQIGWLEKRIRLGGRAFVAVRKIVEGGPRKVACDELWIVRGDGARYLKTDGLTGMRKDLILGMWSHGPSRWDWQAVRAILTS